MKISNLLQEGITAASSPENAQSPAPKFGRSDKFLEDETVEECTTAGSVASVDSPVGGMQRRGKGSIFSGIKTSAKFPNSQAVKEGDSFGSFAGLKDWQVWNVHVYNNYYRGKYADYGPRLYSVVASSPDEARQVVIDNADYVLQDLLSRKLQSGKKVLPRGSALPVEEKRVGKAEPGSITTVGFKEMLTPEGPMKLKFAGGKIVASENETVDEGVWGDTAKLVGIPAVAGALAVGAGHLDKQQPHVEIGGQSAKIIHADSTMMPRDTMLLKGSDGKMYHVWMTSGKGSGHALLASPADKEVKEAGGNVPSGMTWQNGKLQKRPELVAAAKGNKNYQAYLKRKAAKEKAQQEQGQLDEVNPHNYDSDEDYYAALKAPVRQRSSVPPTRGVDPDDEAYFREIFRKNKLAQQQKEREADHERLATGTNEAEELDEKSKSKAQFRMMAAVAHNPEFAKKVGIKQSVGKEFHKADKGANYKSLPDKVDEAGSPAQQAAIAISKKEKNEVDEEKQRLDPKCWTGYKKQGTKMKGGVRVNNCVKVDEAEVSEDKLAQDLYKDLQIFKKGADKDIGAKAKNKDLSTKAKDKDIVAKESFNGEYDDEAGSTESNLLTTARAVKGLLDTIEDRDNLPEWVQEKIAKAEGMLVASWDYLQSQKEQGVDPQVDEDWQKVNKHDKTDGMSPKAVKAYRRENPGSKLKTAVTTKPSKLKAGSKDAKRRKSFCARMSGVKGPMKDEHGEPTAKAKALRRWNC